MSTIALRSAFLTESCRFLSKVCSSLPNFLTVANIAAKLGLRILAIIRSDRISRPFWDAAASALSRRERQSATLNPTSSANSKEACADSPPLSVGDLDLMQVGQPVKSSEQCDVDLYPGQMQLNNLVYVVYAHLLKSHMKLIPCVDSTNLTDFPR